MTIAIDGPVGAGKSTIAQGVADALGILHLDMGAVFQHNAAEIGGFLRGVNAAPKPVLG